MVELSIKTHEQIQRIFNDTFSKSHNTLLVGGHDEPLYQAFRGGQPARICYRADYASSALHEVAHWCIAGKQRRQLDDYGYWYHAEGRNQQQQFEFEAVEVKPQALESLFSLAVGIKFRLSIDNFSQANLASEHFCAHVKQQAIDYLSSGLPERASQFIDAIVSRSETKKWPTPEQLELLEFRA